LTDKEEETLLKGIIDVPPGHEKWPEKTKDFWASLSVKVPFEGVELNITVDEDGEPEERMQYIIYKWALKHKQVGANETEMQNEPGKRFYIHDPEKDLLKRNEKVQVRKDADREFIKVSSEIEKMKVLVRVLLNTDPNRMAELELENSLYDYKTNNPERFLKYSRDPNLEIQAEIEEMIEASVLRKIGNQIIFGDETIGEDTRDAITYFKNKKNSGQVNVMKARLKEAS